MSTRQTFSISFYCRASKADKKGFAPIELSLVINGERTYLKLQRKERPEIFKKAMESKRDNEIKIYCDNQRVRVNQIVEDMEYADIELTPLSLKECLKKGGVANFYTLGQMWADLIENKNSELRTGDIEQDTFDRYKLAMNALYAACELNPDSPAKIVDIQHLNKLQQYLREGGKKQNTIYQYHAKCKSAFTLAFNRGKIKANPYGSFKMDKGEKKEKVWLTDEELARLKKTVIELERLSRIRDIFLFQCYSGLSFSDMDRLNKSDYVKNDLGQIVIVKNRKKTGKLFKSFVLRDGVEILEKYDYELPKISNGKYNAYLKEVQTLCRITKTLHTHLGRTTYICYLYRNGVGVDTIAEIVGHATCKTTLKYYAGMDSTSIGQELRKMNVAEYMKGQKQEKKLKPHKGHALED